ncbi:MAG: clan AA aspartic protease [Chloroflexi bacterium]|nr:clan AA aspartic protease [Chloroflexota bacterium]
MSGCYECLERAGRASGALQLRGQLGAEHRVIEGAVNAAYEAVVPIAVSGPAGRVRDVEAVIDTGYNGFLTLPPVLVAELGLSFVSNGQAILADGGEATFDIHSVTVLLDGQPRDVDVYVSDTAPLVGMRLLDGHGVCIEVESGGRVVIERGTTG